MNKRQSGFTLVEIAIVLVIIGLLLGGILKGQELINSARVRNLADLSTGVQAAYFGFLDRYRQVAGDMDQATATNAIGQAINGPPAAGATVNNGRLDPTAALPWDEVNGAWEQLSAAGFIQGGYLGTAATEPTSSNNLAPVNPWNNPMFMGISPDYQGLGPGRLNLVLGRGIPVSILRELDTKIDDGQPLTGVMRATLGTPTIFVGANNWGGSAGNCVTTVAPIGIYDTTTDSQDCNAVYLF